MKHFKAVAAMSLNRVIGQGKPHYPSAPLGAEYL
jgi:hypothetical protein